MKKNLIILLICLFLIPLGVKAAAYDSYNTLNLEETLKDEGIEKDFTSYKESSKKINIYMFRGKGCHYCQSFLSYLNSITDDYGKYFNLVSFETWNDANNKILLDNVSTFLGEKASGVPYIVIGKKIFPGYTSSYDNDIKDAIKSLYNTKAEDRYDVFEDMIAKNVSLTEVTSNNDTTADTNDTTSDNYSATARTESSSTVKSNTGLIILVTFFFIALSTIILIITVIINCNKVYYELNKIEKLLQKKGYK